MSRRKRKTLKSENLRKEKSMILRGANMSNKKWQEYCQWLSRMGRAEKEADSYTLTRKTHKGRRVLRAVVEGEGK